MTDTFPVDVATFFFFFGIVYFRLCQAAINRSSEVVLWDAAI